jgi:fructose-bisphosphate aldolase class 1
MTTIDLGRPAQALVADGRAILAADETVPTMARRLAALMIVDAGESAHPSRDGLHDARHLELHQRRHHAG